MANKKISGLDPTALLLGTELFAIVQPVDDPKDNRKITLDQISDYVSGTITGTHSIENYGVPLTDRDTLNFTNGLSAIDNDPNIDIKLGGSFIEDTTLTGSNTHSLIIGQAGGQEIVSLNIASTGLSEWVLGETGMFYISNTNVAEGGGSLFLTTYGFEIGAGVGTPAQVLITDAGITLSTAVSKPMTFNARSTNVTEVLSIVLDPVVTTPTAIIDVTAAITTFAGLQYGTDFSANFTASSLINKEYADTNYWNLGVDSVLLADVIIDGVTGGFDVSFDLQDYTLTASGTALLSSESGITVQGLDADLFLQGVQGPSTVRTRLTLSSSQATFSDFRAGALAVGLEYGADYSANFTSLSLINKGYADATYAPLSGGAYWSLASGGTLTGANTIAMAGFNVNFLNGNMLIGPTAATITANTKVDIRGTGTTSNLALRIADSSNNTKLTFTDAGVMTLSPITGSAGISFSSQASIGSTSNGAGYVPDGRGILINGSTTTQSNNVLTVVNGGSFTATSGTQSIIGASVTFAPTSGNATFNGFNVFGTINQTGGANGQITYYNTSPTITAAVNVTGFDWNPTVTSITGTHLAFRATSGQVVIGNTTAVANNRLRVTGLGNTTGYTLLLEDSGGTDRFKFTDGGLLAIGDITPLCNLHNNGSTGFNPNSSAAASLTLDLTKTIWVFTGTTSTWTLPALSSTIGAYFIIKNRGTGDITLQRAGADELWDTTNVTSITIRPGGAQIIHNDGTYWNVM